MNEPVAIVELGGEVTWLTDVLPYKAKLYTHPVKELTDEEMEKIFYESHFNEDCDVRDFIEFARAILRKAQEK